MQKQHVSIRLRPEGWYSVDISYNEHCGGYCQLKPTLFDCFDFIESYTGKKLKRGLRDNIEKHSWHTDFKFWH